MSVTFAAQAKIIALYFPQLHAIPENDKWWGKGFTDWNNIRRARPQFVGHYQPRIPLDGNYYDQSKLETIRYQASLAKKYGIYGFCHYHYWFDGKQLLETPTNLLRDNKDIDIPFCLSWANETWSRRWDGQDHHILIRQTHPPTEESWRKHFNYLITFWEDPRAIRIEGRPVFIIYRPHRIDKINQMVEFWRELALKEGIPGIYLIAQKQYEFPDRKCLEPFDAIFQFQPFESIFHPTYNPKAIGRTFWRKILQKLPSQIKAVLKSIHSSLAKELTFYDYDEIWEEIIKIRWDTLTTYPGAFVDWDNTARYQERATIFTGASPEKFQNWLHQLITTMPTRKLPENFIFLNAWNEWSESAYLEPDERYGLAYLEAIRSTILGNT